MAYRCYGYGNWDAPYWFIGPEQGQSRNLAHRVEAWLDLGGKELCDCRAFHTHNLIRESRWHRDHPQLQSTWKSLILLLLTFQENSTDDPTDDEIRRIYQRDRWGMAHNGETCVIELSGLPANNSKVQIDHKQFRQERIAVIRERIRAHKPVFVVMYGKGEQQSWEQIASQTLKQDKPSKIGSTVFLFTLHPRAHDLKKDYWDALGKRLRKTVDRPNI